MADRHRAGQLSERLGRSTPEITRADGQYAVHSHPKLHEDVLSVEQIEDAIVPLSPRPGEETLRTEDILSTLDKYGDSVSPPCVEQDLSLKGEVDRGRLAPTCAVLYRPAIRYPFSCGKGARDRRGHWLGHGAWDRER